MMNEPINFEMPTSRETRSSKILRKKQEKAVKIIERAYARFRDRQVFKLLVHSICAAEYSMSFDILKKVNPKEAEFLRESNIPYKVRFRFGGESFPPVIFFKVFLDNDAAKFSPTTTYLSGKRVIRAASDAAADAINLMGNRLFLKQILADSCEYHQRGVTDEADVATVRDFMQFRTYLDETAARVGGKDNRWRKLNLEDLPRHTIFYDVIDLATNGRRTERLNLALPLLMQNPVDQRVQRRQIDILSRFFPPIPQTPSTLVRPSMRKNNLVHGRRSKIHQARVTRLRNLYTGTESGSLSEAENASGAGNGRGSRVDDDNLEENETAEVEEDDEEEDDDEEDEWEEEAEHLYQWSQNLSVDSI